MHLQIVQTGLLVLLRTVESIDYLDSPYMSKQIDRGQTMQHHCTIDLSKNHQQGRALKGRNQKQMGMRPAIDVEVDGYRAARGTVAMIDRLRFTDQDSQVSLDDYANKYLVASSAIVLFFSVQFMRQPSEQYHLVVGWRSRGIREGKSELNK